MTLRPQGFISKPESRSASSSAAPNRDPSRYSDPDRFDITRDPTIWSFTFSMGQHFCLGQALARAELQETAAAIARHTRDLELTAEPQWQPKVMVNLVDRCPIRYRFIP